MALPVVDKQPLERAISDALEVMTMTRCGNLTDWELLR